EARQLQRAPREAEEIRIALLYRAVGDDDIGNGEPFRLLFLRGALVRCCTAHCDKQECIDPGSRIASIGYGLPGFATVRRSQDSAAGTNCYGIACVSERDGAQVRGVAGLLRIPVFAAVGAEQDFS